MKTNSCNILQSIYNSLNDIFVDKIKLDEKMDSLIKLILMNNGCKFSDNLSATTYTIDSNIYMYYIRGALGNDVNEYFDYFELFGSKYFIIFLDYFDSYFGEDYEKLSEEEKEIFGKNSELMNKLAELIEIMLNTVYGPVPKKLNATVHKSILNLSPYIIAAKIMSNVIDLTEKDFADYKIPYDTIKEYLEIPIEYLLTGVKVLP